MNLFIIYYYYSAADAAADTELIGWGPVPD